MSDTSQTQEASVSLPDQLPIIVESSEESVSDTPVLLHRKVSVKKRQSKLLQKVLRPKQLIVKRYFTAGVKINDKNSRSLKDEISPFSYPQDMEQFAVNVMNKAWRNDERLKELQQKYFNRPSYKERQKMDLLNRLYVKDPTSRAAETMADINPEYYEIVQGRPIPEKLDIRQYIQTVRDSLRTKIVIGYREDDIDLIDEALTLEQAMIDIVTKNLQKYVNIFEDFLLKDHHSAMKLLKESDEVSKVTYDKHLEHNSISQKYASLNSSLFTLEEKWRLCKTYQKFLYAVSPLSWRMQQGSSRRASIYVMQQPADDFIIGAFRSSILTKGISIQDIIREFRDEVNLDNKPQLFFSKPEELMDVFRFMEMQNLNSLLHSEELARPLETIKEGMRTAVQTFDLEIKNLQEVIDILEGGIQWEENRAKYLEELASDLLNNEFKNLIVDDEILNLHVIVEDLYEGRIGPNDANIEILEMMKAIEELYRQELLFLDKMPSKQIAQLEGSYYKEEILVMKLAEKAAKEFAEMERIMNNLKKAVEPPHEKKIEKELKKRTPPANPPREVQLPPRSLTTKEEEYLEHFTQFCKHTDDPRQFGIDTTADPDIQKFVYHDKTSLPSSDDKIEKY